MPARRLLLPLLAAVAVLVSACGSDDEAGAPSTGASSGAFPVTLTQKTGEVTVKAPPERVVALDFPSADAALALGANVVGMYEVSYVKGGIQEWTKAKLGGQTPELLNTDKGFPLEKIAALRPDLILGTNTYPLVEDAYDKLSAIAPTITHVDAPGVDSWQTGTLQVGKALGKEDEAKRLIADAEAKVAAAKADHPEFAGKSLAFFNYVAGDGLYAVSADTDFSIKFLTELGFSGVAPEIAKLKSSDGRALVSPERYRLLDAGIVIGTSPDPQALEQLHGDPLFQRVPAVSDGHWVGLGIGPATAMAFPSVLSVPYAVDALVPELSAALR
jgi:iron complex transport system substrate-binding protein